MNRLLASALALPLGIGLLRGGDAPLLAQVLEAQYEVDLRTREAALKAKYREALLSLHTEMKEAGDLDAMIAIEAELEPLEPEAVASSAAPVFRIPADAGVPAGKVRRDTDYGLLVSWKGSGGATFSLAGLPPGRYAISMDYYAGPFAGGKLQVAVPTSHEVVEVAGGRSWTELRSAPLGEFKVAEGGTNLTISIVQARAIGILELAALHISPLSE